MKAHIITVGDEILIGQIIDTNSAWIGQQLNMQGIEVKEIVSISDTREAILEATAKAFKTADIILMTGGLGPTKDDITKKTLAEYFQTEMVFHEGTHQRLSAMAKKLGFNYTKAHQEQCYMPKNATILVNEMGTAPGMWFEHNGKVLVSMPGVPYEMKYLVSKEVLPRLKANFKSTPIAHRTILTAGMGESNLAELIEDFENNLPKEIKLAYLPNMGKVRLRLTGRGEGEERINALLDKKVAEVKPLIAKYIYGYEKETLESALGKLLKERGETVSTAESCTGGYFAHTLTTVPGSSAYYKGSIIAYSNEIKMNVLGVKAETLDKYGAVSEETVREMVQGSLKVLGTTYAVAISGIAGPGGGRPDKPVGTIWVAVGDNETIFTRKLQLTKNRIKNIHYTASVSANMLRRFLLKKELA